MRKNEVDTQRWNEYLTLRQINILLLFESAERKPLSSFVVLELTAL